MKKEKKIKNIKLRMLYLLIDLFFLKKKEREKKKNETVDLFLNRTIGVLQRLVGT